jgi:hypothetical protein
MNRKPTPLERILFLATAILAGYQVAVGIEGLGSFPILCYTIGFGVLLVANLLLLLMGFDILGTAPVVFLATIIPLSLSLGLIAEFFPGFLTSYAIFTLFGLVSIVVTRYLAPRQLATAALALVHGIAGLFIFILPMILVINGTVPNGFILISLGGALIGLAGLLLFFLREGKSLLPDPTIMKLLPVVFFLTTLSFVIGFAGI